MASRDNYTFIWDPVKFGRRLWPHVDFYNKQEEIQYSVLENDETVVVAGHELGKDFDAAFICLWFFLTRGNDPVTGIPFPCRIVTTSAKDEHLRVLWGEINNFIQTSVVPLDHKQGGPLIINHQEIKRVYQSGPKKGKVCPLSYMVGMVASMDSIAAMQGHHVADTGDGIPKNLFVADECSSVPNEYYKMARSWAKRRLLFGNAWPCDNFFKHAIEGNPKTGDPGGDRPRKRGPGYYRKIIRITALDSPNVRLGLAEIERGEEPSNRVVIPGVKTYYKYEDDLETLTEEEKAVSLEARFYKGKGTMMFPEDWLKNAMRWAKKYETDRVKRTAKSMGVDPGEGTANSVWTIGDERGIIKQISKKTPNTNVIITDTIDLIGEYGLDPTRVFFDRGGGGTQLAYVLRDKGYGVQTVPFNDPPTPEPHTGQATVKERIEQKEQRYEFLNRRAEMYMLLRFALDPDNEIPFGIPVPMCGELIRQLSPIPLRRDSEGRVKMIPKDKRTSNSKEVTMKDLLGCSPDEADSTVLMVFGLKQKARKVEAGAV
jgi:hypothetical protein